MVKKKLDIIWDDEAKKSLRSIYSYIKKRESIDVAKKVRNEIVARSKSLSDFPEKFEEEPNLKDELGNYRYKVIWSYKIIYEITSKAILILDIFHTSRDPSNIKKRK
ncbi:Plasmid stabilization system protein ParE [Marivirga sericea]|uniref:Plasmid stabilization system protein ParE n=1 Tax=Marivirga sericea TaxID=1028 RepID=A0A1X7IC25_9BACT|nr:type II toxin-antitoxin system RelE/ParE family toxin [Marivirga sericea]SMG11683.1 Plasmid stabilization system protein ParE [Marivirga sericea]